MTKTVYILTGTAEVRLRVPDFIAVLMTHLWILAVFWFLLELFSLYNHSTFPFPIVFVDFRHKCFRSIMLYYFNYFKTIKLYKGT